MATTSVLIVERTPELRELFRRRLLSEMPSLTVHFAERWDEVDALLQNGHDISLVCWCNEHLLCGANSVSKLPEVRKLYQGAIIVSGVARHQLFAADPLENTQVVERKQDLPKAILVQLGSVPA